MTNEVYDLYNAFACLCSMRPRAWTCCGRKMIWFLKQALKPGWDVDFVQAVCIHHLLQMMVQIADLYFWQK